MTSYAFSDQAVRDLEAICDYVAQTSPKAASNLFDVIRRKCKLASDFPEMGKRYEDLLPDLRGFTVKGYLIFYYPRADGIDIARVIRGDRDLAALFPDSDQS